MRKMAHYKHDRLEWAFSLFKHRAFKKVQPVAHITKRTTKKLTRTILCSTPALNIDHVRSMIRIKKLAVVVFVVFIIVTIVVYALVIKAYLFEWFDIPSTKYNKKGFLDIAFVDVACIQSTVWITGMVLQSCIKVE